MLPIIHIPAEKASNYAGESSEPTPIINECCGQNSRQICPA
jgi:hypothetical protein